MVIEFLEEAVTDGFITCRRCGNRIKPDAEKCFCGWVNPLVAEGFI